MPGIVLVARLLLAIVFGVAAVGKALDLPGTRRALTDFRLPAPAVAPVSLLLPLAEFVTAVALVPRSSARWGAIAAVCLLVAFSAAIAGAMVRGEAPDCHCFGRVASGLAGGRTLMRNVLLTAAAVFVLADGPGEGVGRWLSDHSAADAVAIVAGLCAAISALLVARLWPENRRLRGDLERMRAADALLPPGLPLGVPAPSFSLPDAGGARIALADLVGRGHPVVLVLVSPGCGPCADMLPDLARWQAALTERLTIAVLSRASGGENQAMAERDGLQNVLVLNSSAVPKAYRMAATPSVVVVGPDGRIASRTYQTRMMVEAVIRSALSTHHAPLLQVLPANGDSGGRREAEHRSPALR